MARSRVRRWLGVLLSILAIALVGLAALNYLYLADLRPDTMVEDTPAARATATSRLEALAQAHGAAAWQGYEVMEVDLVDEWHGALPQRTFMHWADSPQSMRATFIRGTWTGEVELLDGPDAGDRWGIQGWKTWTAEAGEEPSFEPDAIIEFVLPTTQYFLELPLRIKSATVALDAGSAAWNGKQYDRIFASWNTAEPTKEVDQYLLWIDPDSGLLVRADYTVRDQGGPAVGTAHYNDYEDFGGVLMAKEIAIFGVLPGGGEMPIHTFTTESVQWDTVPPSDLRPDPSLSEEGESKPAS